jgi:hypothetical protein
MLYCTPQGGAITRPNRSMAQPPSAAAHSGQSPFFKERTEVPAPGRPRLVKGGSSPIRKLALTAVRDMSKVGARHGQRARYAWIRVRTLSLDRFDHRANWPAKVRNASRLGSHIWAPWMSTFQLCDSPFTTSPRLAVGDTLEVRSGA